MRRFSCFAVCVLLLSACGSAPEKPAPLSFTQYQPLNLSVSDIQIVDEYQSSGRAPYVEQQFTETPAEAVHQWVKERVHAVAADRVLQVTIKDASVKESPVEHGSRYDARLEVEMRIYGDRPLSEASLHIDATRSDTLPESASLNARKAFYARMVKNLMDAANAELEKNIYKYFSAYITYPAE